MLRDNGCCWPLAITTMGSPCRAPLLTLGADAGEDGQCPAGTRGGCNPTAGNWGRGSTKRVLAASLYRKGRRVISAPSGRSTSETRIRLCGDLPLRSCGPHGRSACFSAAPCWMPPLAQTRGRWRCPPAPWRGWQDPSGEGDTAGDHDRCRRRLRRVATARRRPAGLVSCRIPALEPLIAALPPQTLWEPPHRPGIPAGVDRVLALAQRLGRPASWWLPGIWCPSRRLGAPLRMVGPRGRAVSPCAAGTVQ